MPITEITVSVKRLIALKKYENVTYECGAKATVPPGSDPNTVYLDTLSFCKEKILAEMERLENS